jgi:hypothetical protein
MIFYAQSLPAALFAGPVGAWKTVMNSMADTSAVAPCVQDISLKMHLFYCFFFFCLFLCDIPLGA